MTTSLEQIALKISKEVDEWHSKLPHSALFGRSSNVWVQEYSRRLVAELGGQEPIGVVSEDTSDMYIGGYVGDTVIPWTKRDKQIVAVWLKPVDPGTKLYTLPPLAPVGEVLEHGIAVDPLPAGTKLYVLAAARAK